jgi:AAA+ superfamily predicted ATPase
MAFITRTYVFYMNALQDYTCKIVQILHAATKLNTSGTVIITFDRAHSAL